MTTTVARRFEAFTASEEPLPLGAVLYLFDELPAVEPRDLLGDWEGSWIPTGHPGERRLAQIGWAGQRFRGRDDVDPLMCLDDKGRRRAVSLVGDARLRRVEYRDVLTASVVYDQRPFLDHLRRVGDELVMGMMDRKGEAWPLPFWLRRIAGPEECGEDTLLHAHLTPASGACPRAPSPSPATA